jgi:flavin-dependent dehydrogenase
VTRPEVIVLGGGPAGAAAARECAKNSLAVALVERERFPRPHVGEALAPPALRLLDAIGPGADVRGAGFTAVRRSVVLWGAEAPRLRPAFQAPGLVVDRGRFDALLLASAAAAGVEVIQPASAGRPVRRSRGWCVPLRDRGELTADLLIDARGRAAGAGRVADGAATAALCGYWVDVPELAGEVVVEAADDAWLWAGRLSDGRWSVIAFVAAAACAGRTAPARTALYTRLLARSRLLRVILHGRPAGPVAICDATPGHVPRPVRRGRILAGEAAVALDPLSSQGVQAAIVSGLQAATVATTWLRRPAEAAAATRFYVDRIAETAARNRAHAAAAYAAETARAALPFWRERAVIHDTPREPVSGIRLTRVPVIAGPVIEVRRAVRRPGLARPLAVLAEETS